MLVMSQYVGHEPVCWLAGGWGRNEGRKFFLEACREVPDRCDSGEEHQVLRRWV